jgi:hypothetical protein
MFPRGFLSCPAETTEKSTPPSILGKCLSRLIVVPMPQFFQAKSRQFPSPKFGNFQFACVLPELPPRRLRPRTGNVALCESALPLLIQCNQAGKSAASLTIEDTGRTRLSAYSRLLGYWGTNCALRRRLQSCQRRDCARIWTFLQNRTRFIAVGREYCNPYTFSPAGELMFQMNAATCNVAGRVEFLLRDSAGLSPAAVAWLEELKPRADNWFSTVCDTRRQCWETRPSLQEMDAYLAQLARSLSDLPAVQAQDLLMRFPSSSERDVEFLMEALNRLHHFFELAVTGAYKPFDEIASDPHLDQGSRVVALILWLKVRVDAVAECVDFLLQETGVLAPAGFAFLSQLKPISDNWSKTMRDARQRWRNGSTNETRIPELFSIAWPKALAM